METEQIASSTRRVIPSRRGHLAISGERDIPLLELVRDCTYITRPQIEELGIGQVGRWKETYRNRTRRLTRLVDMGQLTMHGQALPYRGMVYSIGRAGLVTLEFIGNGLLNVTSESEALSNDRQIPHFLGLNQARIQLLSSFTIRNWLSDRVLQSLNISTNTPTAKDYDAIFELALTGPDRLIKVAFEYERTLKSRERYAEIRGLLETEAGVSGVLYVVEGWQAVNALSGLVYSRRCPVAITMTSWLGARGADAEVRMVSGNTIVRSKLNSFLLSLK
jgi:hypothetical protein